MHEDAIYRVGPRRARWSGPSTEPGTFEFEDAIDTLCVRIVGGAVNVVGTDEGPARMEVTELEGPPLQVRRHGSSLTVTYDDLSWKGLLKWHRPRRLAAPRGDLARGPAEHLGRGGSGRRGRGDLRDQRAAPWSSGVYGDITLVGLTGPVRANTVSGSVEAQSVTGDLRVNSVSGDLTVVEGSGTEVTAPTPSAATWCSTSPRPAVPTSASPPCPARSPSAYRTPADAEVEANTASGARLQRLRRVCRSPASGGPSGSPAGWARAAAGCGPPPYRAPSPLLRRPPLPRTRPPLGEGNL